MGTSGGLKFKTGGITNAVEPGTIIGTSQETCTSRSFMTITISNLHHVY